RVVAEIPCWSESELGQTRNIATAKQQFHPDRRWCKRSAITTARIAERIKLAGTQDEARAIPSSAVADASPLALATSPAIAPPSANPICWMVGTEEAATVSSPALAPSMMRCATKGQHWPMPAPSMAIAGINSNVVE